MALDKRWIVKEPGNPAMVRNLASELGVDHSLANLLVQRNITNLSQAKSFSVRSWKICTIPSL